MRRGFFSIVPATLVKLKRSRVYRHESVAKGYKRRTRRHRFMVVGFLFIFAAGVAYPLLHESTARAWWNTSWQYRRKITLDNSASGSTLTNFPIRVSLNTSRITYANTLAGGADLRFVSSDDVTQLSYEIEQWTSGGTSEVWVRIPSLPNNNTSFIYMYYGNSSATDGQNRAAVWDSNYIIVQHDNDAANVPGIVDSTAYNAHGTPNVIGHPVATSSGKIAGAQNYVLSAANDYYAMQQHTNILDNYTDVGYTLHAWVKPSTIPTVTTGNQDYAIMGKRGKFSGTKVSYNSGSNAKITAIQYDGAGSPATHVANSTTLVTAGNWYFVEMVADIASNLVRLYVNGVQEGTSSLPSLYDYWPTDQSNSNQWPIVGKGDPGTACTASFGYCMDGVIDEVRWSSSARSADWIKAEYTTENDAMNTFAGEEILPPDKPILTALGIAASTTPVFQLRASDQHTPNYLRYKIQVCDDAACVTVLNPSTDDQTTSQAGWTGQDAQTSTAYVASATLGSSTLATHTYQGTALTAGRAYWWRAQAIDPGDSISWSDWSAIGTFTTEGAPKAPTLITPANGATNVPYVGNTRFELVTWDVNASNVKYKIELCTVSNCIPVSQTFNQVSTPAGWTAQAGNSATTYFTDPASASLSQVATYFTQTPLAANTTYYWQASAIDPSGSNTFGSTSTISSFTTANTSGAGNNKTRILGGTVIRGGTNF